MALILSNAGSKGELVKTNWTPEGSSGSQVCTNATIGNYYGVDFATANAGSEITFSGAELVGTIRWTPNSTANMIIKATATTITCTASGTYNTQSAVEFVLQ